MNHKDARIVLDAIESQVFEYCFLHYSSFKEIDDRKFHKLVDDFDQAYSALAEYVGYK